MAEWGKYAGTQVFRAEDGVGLAMMRGLSPEQQAKAINRYAPAGRSAHGRLQ